MKVKEESEKAGLKLNTQKTKIMASSPITSWQIDGETEIILGGSKITADGDCSHEIKRHLLQYLYFKLNLQEDSFIELFAVQHEDFTKEDLMESKARRKDKERQGEEVTEESHSAANGKGIFFI